MSLPAQVTLLPVPDEARRHLRERFAAGDVDAFRALVAPHTGEVFTICLRMIGRRADAEDVAQETLVRALEKHAQYDSRRPFRPWLLTIAVNRCRDRMRTVWWRRIVPFERAEATDELRPDRCSAAAQRDELVRRALATLPPLYREAVTLFHLQDLCYAEMAEILGASVPALKQRVRRGCEMLRAAVQRMYPELAADRRDE